MRNRALERERERKQVVVVGGLCFRDCLVGKHFAVHSGGHLQYSHRLPYHPHRGICGLCGHLPSSAAKILSSLSLHCKFLLLPFDIFIRCWMMLKLISFLSSFELLCEKLGFVHVRFLWKWGKLIWWCFRECLVHFDKPLFLFSVVCYRGVGS